MYHFLRIRPWNNVATFYRFFMFKTKGETAFRTLRGHTNAILAHSLKAHTIRLRTTDTFDGQPVADFKKADTTVVKHDLSPTERVAQRLTRTLWDEEPIQPTIVFDETSAAHSDITRSNRDRLRKETKTAWKESTRMETLVHWCKKHRKEHGGSMLIFSEFLSALDIAENALTETFEEPQKIARYDGTIPDKERDQVIKDFQAGNIERRLRTKKRQKVKKANGILDPDTGMLDTMTEVATWDIAQLTRSLEEARKLSNTPSQPPAKKLKPNPPPTTTKKPDASMESKIKQEQATLAEQQAKIERLKKKLRELQKMRGFYKHIQDLSPLDGIYGTLNRLMETVRQVEPNEIVDEESASESGGE
ncbi:hypothetical protein ACET3X_006116 [Alternaria dauci]|uniref:Helicase C-terminal domain-containing protein n=1 Tax=Alternaria dauci TaxID=48095 RepID=A0ABR3UHE1_9PLEO